MRRSDGGMIHVRKSTVAEPALKAIYDALGVNALPVNGYRNPPKSGGKDGLRFLVWRALLRGAEMELLNRHADVRGKKD